MRGSEPSEEIPLSSIMWPYVMLISHVTNAAVSFRHNSNRRRSTSLESKKLILDSLEM